MSALQPHSFIAVNPARDSENKMHDDVVARQFGFAGGLVPGAVAFGYMSHMPVAKWGRTFLERGSIEATFMKPIYDGDAVTVTAEETHDGMAISVISRDIACAAGRASLPDRAASPLMDNFQNVKPVDFRKPVDEFSYAEGQWLGTFPLVLTNETASKLLEAVCETDPIYKRENLAHPGHLLRTMNSILMDNALLGPWIHTASKMHHLNAASANDEFTARAKVTANYDRKGHKFVELDGLIISNGVRPIASCQYTAIYSPRNSSPTVTADG